ncbi:hypothetical protein ACXU4B_10240 [Dyella soli]|uniref:RiboL-PSP-HEPN domain-containing protein n=1 Tax=Dyella soli TaxID=522319 RepID=A0A4R0Z087_9GAMM|nr:hypothetical protein [Dyella soli]TCI11304.1 hypothetical protein EZM97_21130 [Dyella soli]
MKRNWSPAKSVLLLLGLFFILSISTSLIGLERHLISLNESQVLYLFSTSAQVIAGIYGLTITGFIFFRNELSREEFEDETLMDVVESLKRRYSLLLLFVTAFVLLTLLLSNLAIAYEAYGEPTVRTIIVNTAQSSFVVSLLAITYFIFDVIAPKRIQAASQRLQNKLDPSRSSETKGGLEAFLRNYNQIEDLLFAAGDPYKAFSTIAYRTTSQRRLSNSRLADILYRNNKIDARLLDRLKDLITLRNSIIHGADPVVSETVVEKSSLVLSALRAALESTSG